MRLQVRVLKGHARRPTHRQGRTSRLSSPLVPAGPGDVSDRLHRVGDPPDVQAPGLTVHWTPEVLHTFRANLEADTAWSASCARSRGCRGGHNVDSAVRCTARRCRGFGSIRRRGECAAYRAERRAAGGSARRRGATILRIRQLISVHVYVGVLLVGPVLLKCASTVYRFIRYYAGARAYRQKGPPSRCCEHSEP